VRQVRNLQ